MKKSNPTKDPRVSKNAAKPIEHEAQALFGNEGWEDGEEKDAQE